ncbi:GAF domain-containing protein [Streptomyces monticola]|uniref:GAF domain-containing protein n=1 Tax=Streptomyces monticola TaxID=2666263 RepID=A0ABW2JGA3_9ACTN
MVDGFTAAQTVLEAAEGDPAELPQRLCRAMCEALSVDGASLSLFTQTSHRQLLCATDASALKLEELQFGLGEGPCVTAAETNSPVIVGDMSRDLSRWPLFGISAREQLPEVGAVYAFPLQFGTRRAVGSTDLLLLEPLEPDEETVQQGLAAARAAGMALLHVYQATQSHGELPPWEPADILDTHWGATHQAVGMLAEHLEITIEEALARMRARAFVLGRPLPEVAVDVRAHLSAWEDDDAP